jgi:hypothetical protein
VEWVKAFVPWVMSSDVKKKEFAEKLFDTKESDAFKYG